MSLIVVYNYTCTLACTHSHTLPCTNQLSIHTCFSLLSVSFCFLKSPLPLHNHILPSPHFALSFSASPGAQAQAWKWNPTCLPSLAKWTPTAKESIKRENTSKRSPRSSLCSQTKEVPLARAYKQVVIHLLQSVDRKRGCACAYPPTTHPHHTTPALLMANLRGQRLSNWWW